VSVKTKSVSRRLSAARYLHDGTACPVVRVNGKEIDKTAEVGAGLNRQ